MSRKERHFQGITREIRNFSENNDFRVIIFVSSNFVSEGTCHIARYFVAILSQKCFVFVF